MSNDAGLYRILELIWFFVVFLFTLSHELTYIIPDVHVTAKRGDVDKSLTQKIIRLSCEFLTQSGFYIIIFIPERVFPTKHNI